MVIIFYNDIYNENEFVILYNIFIILISTTTFLILFWLVC